MTNVPSNEGWDDPKGKLAKPAAIKKKESNLSDPKHPLNNPQLMREVHFVGRKAMDPSIVQLSTMLINHDTFGSITELWLNNNLISDDGVSSFAAFDLMHNHAFF